MPYEELLEELINATLYTWKKMTEVAQLLLLVRGATLLMRDEHHNQEAYSDPGGN